MLVRLNKPYCTFEQLQPAPVHKVKRNFTLIETVEATLETTTLTESSSVVWLWYVRNDGKGSSTVPLSTMSVVRDEWDKTKLRVIWSLFQRKIKGKINSVTYLTLKYLLKCHFWFVIHLNGIDSLVYVHFLNLFSLVYWFLHARVSTYRWIKLCTSTGILTVCLYGLKTVLLEP